MKALKGMIQTLAVVVAAFLALWVFLAAGAHGTAVGWALGFTPPFSLAPWIAVLLLLGLAVVCAIINGVQGKTTPWGNASLGWIVFRLISLLATIWCIALLIVVVVFGALPIEWGGNVIGF